MDGGLVELEGLARQVPTRGRLREALLAYLLRVVKLTSQRAEETFFVESRGTP